MSRNVRVALLFRPEVIDSDIPLSDCAVTDRKATSGVGSLISFGTKGMAGGVLEAEMSCLDLGESDSSVMISMWRMEELLFVNAAAMSSTSTDFLRSAFSFF